MVSTAAVATLPVLLIVLLLLLLLFAGTTEEDVPLMAVVFSASPELVMLRLNDGKGPLLSLTTMGGGRGGGGGGVLGLGLF